MKLNERQVNTILGIVVVLLVGFLSFGYFRKKQGEILPTSASDTTSEDSEPSIRIREASIDEKIDTFEDEGVICYVYRGYGISCLLKRGL